MSLPPGGLIVPPAKIINRYNSFIVDHPHPGKAAVFYSCPSCYRLTESTPTAPTVTCMHCNTTAPVDRSSGAPAGVTTATKGFMLPVGHNGAHAQVRCDCGHQFSIGVITNASCTNVLCKKTAPVAWDKVCNACLLSRHKAVAATFWCPDNNSYHSTKMPADVKKVGKCDACICGNCKRY